MQLFNLQKDPGEKNNLVNKEPEKVAELLQLLKKQIESGRCTPGEKVPNDREINFLPKGVSLPAKTETSEHTPKVSSRPNILFIAIDDLRPELGCYNAVGANTPNIDRLAKRGVLFSHAYCNIAVCGASRASVFKGLRPTPARFLKADTWAEKDAPNVPSLPLTFKQNGYHTASNGKVYHHLKDDAGAWSQAAWHCDTPSKWWALSENKMKNNGGKRGPAYEAAEVSEKEYPDVQICEKTPQDLRRLAKQKKPFFIACGFHRPHLPFVAPKKYWDKHPRNTIKLPGNMYFPHDLSKAFQYRWGELRSYRGIPKQGPVSRETAIDLIRGYRACVSFADAQVGRLLKEIDELGIAENTIVVLWSDHGWQLGEHGFWCKHTNFEVATHIPFIVVAPKVKGGRVCAKLVEGVDIYPTLCDLANLPKPKHLQGRSMMPLLSDVNANFKEAIYTRFGSGNAIRTMDYRLMEKRAKRGAGKQVGVGLFDLQKDMDENQNIAEKPEKVEVRKRLQKMLNKVRFDTE